MVPAGRRRWAGHCSPVSAAWATRDGAPGRTRTCNHRLRRPVLYPVELRAQGGRGRGIRTPDILLPKQARYQTALYPERARAAGTIAAGLRALSGGPRVVSTRDAGGAR